MSEYFRRAACAIDFSQMAEIHPALKNSKWLPTDLDGITHRFGKGEGTTDFWLLRRNMETRACRAVKKRCFGRWRA
jgi:hypothetical protein